MTSQQERLFNTVLKRIQDRDHYQSIGDIAMADLNQQYINELMEQIEREEIEYA